MNDSLEVARAQADRGMALAELGAINVCEDWPDLAIAFLRRYAEAHEQFPMFFVTQEAERDPAMPEVNPKAWGQVTRSAIKAGIIAKTGTFMPHPRRHACPAIVFRSLVCRP